MRPYQYDLAWNLCLFLATAVKCQLMLPNAQESRLNAADRVARYELLFPLGKGGQGEVWSARLAEHEAFEKRVVLKFIRLDEGDTESARRAFLDEGGRRGVAVAITLPAVAGRAAASPHLGSRMRPRRGVLIPQN